MLNNLSTTSESVQAISPHKSAISFIVDMGIIFFSANDKPLTSNIRGSTRKHFQKRNQDALIEPNVPRENIKPQTRT